MNYREWLVTVPDAVETSKNHLTRDLADQLIRAIDMPLDLLAKPVIGITNLAVFLNPMW
jgi:hypothetical protein